MQGVPGTRGEKGERGPSGPQVGFLLVLKLCTNKQKINRNALCVTITYSFILCHSFSSNPDNQTIHYHLQNSTSKAVLRSCKPFY